MLSIRDLHKNTFKKNWPQTSTSVSLLTETHTHTHYQSIDKFCFPRMPLYIQTLAQPMLRFAHLPQDVSNLR